MEKYEYGQLIALIYDEHDHPEYIKGWVNQEKASDVIGQYYGDDREIVELTHKYGFWGVGQDEMGEPCQIFYERDEPGRGRFKVTELSCKHCQPPTHQKGMTVRGEV